ncbi:MAG: hypothetical protein JXB03_11775 [Spirochaetales bacterium]|nr:hypothetical protein [Spirochaetales bacterium]
MVHRNAYLFLGVFLILCCTARPVYAQEDTQKDIPQAAVTDMPVMVFLPFKQKKGPAHVAALLTGLLEKKYSDQGPFPFIPHMSINQLLAEGSSMLTVERCNDVSCALEVARTIHADYALLGTVSVEANTIDIEGWLYRVDTQEFVYALEKRVYDIHDMDISAAIIARQIGRTLFPSYAQELGLPNMDTDILPSTPVDPVDEDSGSEKPPEKTRVKIGDTTIRIVPGKKPGVTLHSTALLSGMLLTGVSSGLLTSAAVQNYLSDREQAYAESDVPLFESLEAQRRSGAAGDRADTLGAVSLGASACGIGAAGTALWAGGESFLPMSTLGYSLFTAGLFMQMSAGVLDLYALENYGRSLTSHLLYLHTDADFDRLWNDTVTYEDNYKLMSGFSLLLRTGGAAGTVGGFLIGGKKDRISGFWDRVFMSAGMLLWNGGNIACMYALDRQRDMIFARYNAALHEDSPAVQLAYLRDEDAARDSYRTGCIVTGSLWGGGALMFLTAAILDLNDPFSKTADPEDDTKADSPLMSFSIGPGACGPVLVWRFTL